MKVIYAQFFHWLLQKAGYAVAAMLAFAFMIVTAFEHVTAQPAWIGTDVTGAYTTYTLSDLGAFRQSRISTNTSTVSGTVKWEFMKDNAGSPDYTINWRPYGCCLTIIGYNSAIAPVGGTASALYNTGSGGQGGYLPATTATRYYTFNITENSASNNSMCVLETSYIPLTISSSGISQSPAAGSVYPCQSVTVSVTTASAPSSGEYVYVRYTTNGWASSSLVQLSFTGNVGTAVLPTQTSGTTVQYYVMSSNSTSGTIGSNYDLFTLDLLNNSGANYSYTVGSTNVCLTSTSGTTTGGYNTLKSAFDAINAGTHQGAITLNILGNTTETATATLNASGSGSASYSRIIVSPSGSRTVSGSFNGSLVKLRGADNVKIDGLNSGGNSLILENTSSGDSATVVRYENDASNNRLSNCTIKGSGRGTVTSSHGAVICYGLSTGTTGNDNDTLSNCDVGPSGSNYPFQLIKGYGSVGKENDGIQILNNTLHDFYNATGNNTAGILVYAASNGWTISGNKMFHTVNVALSAGGGQPYYGIRIDNSAYGFSITNNRIGYANSSGTGYTTITNTPSNYALEYKGIYLNLGTAVATTVSGNRIGGIDISSSRASATLGSAIFYGITLVGGRADITNNVIGSSTSIDSIRIKSTNNSGATGIFSPCAGIYIAGTSSNTVSGNTIGGIGVSYTGTGTAGTHDGTPFAGILSASSGSSTSIMGNTIGNSQSNNITSSMLRAGAQIAGIRCVAEAAIVIDNNVIQNLNCSVANTGALMNASVIGIRDTSYSSVLPGSTLKRNTISNLTNTASTLSSVTVTGIFAAAPTGAGASSTIERNWIYSLSCNSTNNGSAVIGIYLYAGNTFYIYNNMVSIGSGISNGILIAGIMHKAGIVKVYYNSIRILGAPTSGTGNSYCLYGTSTFLNLESKNNIFVNERSNSGASGKHYAIRLSNSVTYTGVTNDYYVSGTGGVLGYYNGGDQANLSSWYSSTSQDNPSGTSPTLSTSVSFVSTTDLHINTSECTINGAATVISVTVDYDNATRDATAPDIGADEYTYSSTTWTWTGTTSTDWHTKSNWCPPIVPISTSDVLIPSGPTNMPLISNADAVCHTITINSGASVTMSGSTSRQLTVYANSTTGSFANSGTFTAGIGTVVFDGTGTVSGTTATTFYNVISKTGSLTFNNVVGYYSTVSNSFEIQSGGSVTSGAAPFYATGSTLKYNTGGSYTAYEEWFPNNICSSRGVPHHVVVTGNTSLNFGNESYYREMCGDLTINSGSSFTLSSVSGGDLYIKGNWNDAGTFYPNCRMVKFNGTTSDQTITRTGGGTETFNFMAIDKTGYKLILGSSTDVKLQTSTCATNVAYLYMINGDLDLAGRTLFIEGPTSYGGTGATFMWLNVQNGNRTITSSTAAVVDVKSTYANKTLLVVDGGGSGRLIFDTNITLKDASGEIDFGSGNLATVKGVFQVDNGGAATGNSAHYEVGSILRFTNGNDYQVTVSDKTWADGITGDIGIPYHLEITTSSSSTDVIVTSANIADHMIRGNLTITSSTLQLSTGAAGDLYIQGNWNRTNGSFSPNSKKVIFQGSSPQTMSVNTASEGFYGLEINNSNGLTLSSGNANVSNTLYLTTGLITTGSNEVYVTNTAAGAVTNHKTDPTVGGYTSSSYVNGNLRRNVTNATSYDFPVGISSAYQLATINFANVGSNGNVLANFTGPGANGTLGSCTINGTLIIGMLNGGYWTMTPNASTTGVQYDVTLIETGFTGFTYAAYTLGVIKRPNSSTNWSGTDFCSVGCHTNSTQWVNGSFTIAKAVRTQVPSFSDFAIGYSYGTPLPVELTTFTVSPVNDDAYLNWNTSSELNSDYFAVERSLDGNVFSQVGIVDAAGFSVMPNDYAFIDPGVRELNAGKIYYRLRMVHSDGSFEYSAVRWISLDESSHQTVLAYPNPFFDELSLMWYAGGSGTGLIQVSDFSGKMVLEKEIPYTEGNNFLMLDQLASFPDGVYILQLNTGRSTRTLKVVKQ